MDSKSSRSFKNLLSSIIKGISTALIGFIVTPYLVKFVGDEQFGLYKLILDWLSNIWIFDLGVSGAFLAIAAIKFKNSDPKVLFRDGLYKHITALPLMYIACLAFYLITRFIIKLESVSLLDYTISFTIIAATYLFYPLNTFRQYFEVSERLDFINKVTIVQLVLTNLVSLLFAYLGYGLIGLSIAYALFIALGFVYIYTKAASEMDLSLKNLFKDPGEFREMIKGEGRNFLFINISQKLSFLADNTIIAYFYSAAMIVPFIISARLANLFQGQVQSITYAGWASLVAFYNQGEHKLFKKRFIELLKANFILSLSCLCVIWLLNASFIDLWIGKKYFIDQQFTIIISLLGIVNILNFFLGHVLSGTGHVSRQSKAYIISGVSNFLLSIVLTYFIGLHGPVSASLITMFALFLFKLFLLKKTYGIRFFSLVLIFLPGASVATVLIFIYPLILKLMDLSISGWVSLILHAGVIGGLFLILSGVICFSNDERRLWFDRAKRVLFK